MSTIYQDQWPTGILRPDVEGYDLSRYSQQIVAPSLQDGVAIPEIVPFAAWEEGAKTTVVASTPFTSKLFKLDVIVGVSVVSEFRVYLGPPGEEVLLGAVSLAKGKRGFRKIQSAIIPNGSRLSVSVARDVTDPLLPIVKLTLIEVL